jgi:hypothetical protein
MLALILVACIEAIGTLARHQGTLHRCPRPRMKPTAGRPGT